ncbi:MAG: tautomerase family protein [Polaromonas sp.]|uniref:tautomerase family protein n=1 Tax=Polaromonas sp. TaxID=1869339 RepID=UPI0025E3F897|nr:4-oxalocrotonate tautomerase [Polaromonas sp.]MBI2726067.1 tautomerase family protein [Polaromonas sp.]
MPILNVKVSQPASAQLSTQISEMLLELTTRILHKKRELTSIAIDYIAPEHWTVGGSSLAVQGKNSFYFDIKVVDGTNTKDEKAQYIAESFQAFEKLLGNVHDESYIHIHDVRAEAYGFGGRTQEWRYIKAKP